MRTGRPLSCTNRTGPAACIRWPIWAARADPHQQQHRTGSKHMKRIAFIGLGNMGGPMAANLVKAGFEVQAFDLSAAALETARAAGVGIAASATDAVREAQVVISMLPASRHVESLYLGDGGLLEQLPEGVLVIDCSTIAP